MRKNYIEGLLHTSLTNEEFNILCEYWRAFTTCPEQYENSIVVEMVSSWLDELRNK